LFVGSDVSDMLPLVLLLHSLSNKFVSDPPRLLNYLTAPHCLVWSAAVASSSLPGKSTGSFLFVLLLEFEITLAIH